MTRYACLCLFLVFSVTGPSSFAAQTSPPEVSHAPALTPLSAAIKEIETDLGVGRCHQAQVKSQALLKVQPANALAWTYLDRASVRLEQAPRVRVILEEVVRDDPSFISARVLLANVYYRLKPRVEGKEQQQAVRNLEAQAQKHQHHTDQTEDHAGKGLELVQQGDLKGAESELRRAVELSPKNPTYLASLGSVLGMQQKLEESSVYFERALQINPSDLATRRSLASNQFQLGQLQQAKENLAQVLKARPEDSTACLLLGMVSEESKDYPKAVELLSSVVTETRKQPNSLAALARSYYNTGHKPKAQETLRELQNHPAGVEAAFLGGQVATQAKDFETAELLFSSIRSTYPDAARIGYHLAWAQYQRNQLAKSETTLRQLLAAGHESSDIDNLLSWSLHKQDKFKEAVAAMDRAIELSPSRESNYLDLGMILIAHQRLPVALEAAKKAVEVAPNSYQAYMLKGLVEAKMNYLIEAAKTYTRAVELNPAAPEAILALALIFSSDGKKEEAEASFKRAIEKFPRNAMLYQEYARMLLKFGESGDRSAESRAASMFETALRLDGSLAESHFQLGSLALNDDKTQAALQHLEAAVNLNPDSSKIHFALARAYRRLGRSEEAAKELQTYEKLKVEEERSNAGESK